MNRLLSKLLDKSKSFFHQFYKVPYCVPAWGWPEHWAIIKCLLTGRIIEGRHKELLYESIRNKTGTKYVFGFNSGQEAIYAALRAWGIGKDDKVIMPSYCCETVAKAVLKSGAQPLFCDINNDYTPNVNHISEILDRTVKAIIFPHLFGNPGAIDKLESILEKREIRSKIFIIDDAAQSFGAKLNGRLLGTFGDAGIISFGPGKTMTASGGGLILTNSEKLAGEVTGLPVTPLSYTNKIKKLIYWLIFRRWRKYTLPFYPLFKRLLVTSIENNKNIIGFCNVDAAIATEQLSKLDLLLEKRINRKNTLDKRLKYNLGVKYNLTDNKDNVNVVTKYVIQIVGKSVPGNIQKLFKLFFSKRGIEIMDLYFPIHYKNEYRENSTSLPQTEKIYKSILQIPIEPSMKQSDFDFVVNLFFEFLMRYKKDESMVKTGFC